MSAPLQSWTASPSVDQPGVEALVAGFAGALVAGIAGAEFWLRHDVMVAE